MTGWVRQILERYGQKVTVQTGETTVDVRAFLQPVPERNERAREEATPIGWVDVRLWLYLGRRELAAGDLLRWRGMTLRVRSCRPYYIGEALSHFWAALEPEREAAECGS